jgi:K+/H+ antiporter YhaU regulatory subunit KhtT
MTSTPTVDDHDLTAERLPGVGRRYELTRRNGQRLSVVIDSRGSRHISVIARDRHSSPGTDVVVLNEAQASLLSCILAGTYDQAKAAWFLLTTRTS